ncbi:MAG TPA: hypothetical protein VGL56_11815 [Fimbriimonadaceae bacterium]|jgi:hypothetical protein
MNNLLAAIFGPDILALCIPIIALMIPIVAILVSHQQKMAAIIHGGRNPQTEAEIAGLQQEIRSLQGQLHAQTIAMDELRSAILNVPPQMTAQPDIQQRVGF